MNMSLSGIGSITLAIAVAFFCVLALYILFWCRVDYLGANRRIKAIADKARETSRKEIAEQYTQEEMCDLIISLAEDAAAKGLYEYREDKYIYPEDNPKEYDIHIMRRLLTKESKKMLLKEHGIKVRFGTDPLRVPQTVYIDYILLQW